MAAQVAALQARGVRVVELELADDLGQAGPSIADFGRRLAGDAYTNPDWTFGVASDRLTTTYDPAGNLDVYYPLDRRGRVVYINGSPASTMSALLSHVEQL